jgi:hypothetical protein
MNDEVKRILDMVAAGRLGAAEAAALLEALGSATGDGGSTDERSASMTGNATGQVDTGAPSARRTGQTAQAAPFGVRLGGRLTLDQLVEFKQQGVTPGFVAELEAAGYADLSADQLVEFRQQGVTAKFIHELRDVGVDHLSPDQLVEARQQGVDGAYVRAMHDAGAGPLSLSRLVELRQHGITPDDVRQLAGSAAR